MTATAVLLEEEVARPRARTEAGFWKRENIFGSEIKSGVLDSSSSSSLFSSSMELHVVFALKCEDNFKSQEDGSHKSIRKIRASWTPIMVKVFLGANVLHFE